MQLMRCLFFFDPARLDGGGGIRETLRRSITKVVALCLITQNWKEPEKEKQRMHSQ